MLIKACLFILLITHGETINIFNGNGGAEWVIYNRRIFQKI